ncbi:MAG: DNA polymerase III subunit chi [Gammaproteobacteria bacterium]|jgi:DNA polymerase III subunit chi|nr:DNA polymerase III subunit chi [Gammaproteobacteria bacterium]
MPRVDFYILSEQGNRERFTCDIATKIRKQNLQLYIHASSREEAGLLDDLLWTHNEISFLPHSLIDADDADANTVTIGWEGMNSKSNEVLINLSTNIPDFAGNFDRIVEIVPANEPYRQQARERYKEYRQAGFELHNNDLRSANADV